MSVSELKELASAPYGAATKAIRQHDPLWGRPGGERIEWCVTISRKIIETAKVIVEAASADEAEDMVDDIPNSDLNWEPDYLGSYEIESVEPLP